MSISICKRPIKRQNDNRRCERVNKKCVHENELHRDNLFAAVWYEILVTNEEEEGAMMFDVTATDERTTNGAQRTRLIVCLFYKMKMWVIKKKSSILSFSDGFAFLTFYDVIVR